MSALISSVIGLIDSVLGSSPPQRGPAGEVPCNLSGFMVFGCRRAP
ncbi:MAG: hypothetical protein ACREGK_10950 [Geminicoccales bacterium]